MSDTENLFDNLLDRILLTSSEMELLLRSYPLIFPQQRDTKVEWGMEFPMFVPAFYCHLIDLNSVPSQLEYWCHYLEINRPWFDGMGYNDKILTALKARVYRTYPSIIRDLHFALMARESHLFGRVVYNLGLDIKHGIDLIIESRGDYFAVGLFVETLAGRDARNIKEHRHVPIEGVYYMDLPLDMRAARQVGDFYVYSMSDLSKLRRSIDANLYGKVPKSVGSFARRNE